MTITKKNTINTARLFLFTLKGCGKTCKQMLYERMLNNSVFYFASKYFLLNLLFSKTLQNGKSNLCAFMHKICSSIET